LQSPVIDFPTLGRLERSEERARTPAALITLFYRFPGYYSMVNLLAGLLFETEPLDLSPVSGMRNEPLPQPG
jgi:hypothetical protein